MVRVLIVITTAFVPYGGLTTVAMNYYRNMDKSGLKIDFASVNKPSKELIDELHENGSEYYCLGERKKHPLKYQYALWKLLKEKRYDIIHVHANSASAVLELLSAKKCGVKKRIVHIHNSTCSHMLLHRLLKPLFDRTYTDALACSREAGKWIFGEEFIILNNAIDTEKYQFKEESRKKIRAEYGIRKETFVIGHVGKINKQKNHTFLIECFYEVNKKMPDAVLLLVGDGPLRKKIEEKIKCLGLEKNVYFAGMKNNASEYLSAMDCFVFPSVFEGFSLALLEALSSGLKCIASENTRRESEIMNCVKYLSLELNASKWCKEILKSYLYNRMQESKKNISIIKKENFDIKINADLLKQYYNL